LIPLLAALMAGYGLGKLMVKSWPAYLICVPLSSLVYFVTKLALTLFQSNGMEIPGLEMAIVVGIMQSPLLMLGVFLGRKHSKRSSFET
jgi:hypothetical protein